MQAQYNLRSPSVKRLMKEAQELSVPTELFYAQPLEENLFEWHFTIRGPADSEFDGGIYHGRILLPPEYPMKPPSIMLLTPNGRFEIFKKICLSISGHHPESWQPSWSIRTALLAIVGFMPTHGHGAIGSLDYTPNERKILARKSLDWKCPHCGSIKNALKPVTEASKKDTEEAKELATQIDFQADKEKKKGNNNTKDEEKKTAADGNAGVSDTEAANTKPPTGLTAADYSQFYGGSFPMLNRNMPIMPYIPPQLYKAYQERLQAMQASSEQQNMPASPSPGPSVSKSASAEENVSTAVPETANEANTVAEPAQPAASGVRQRIRADRQQTSVAPQAQTHQPAELPSQASQTARSENKFVLLIMFLLSFAIIILVARRIYFMPIWKFDSDT